MVETRTFFQYCVYICVALFIFSLMVNFVSGLDVFPTKFEVGFQEGSSTSETFTNITNLTYQDDSQNLLGMDALWQVALAAGGAGAVIGALVRSPAMIGVSIFGGVFWASYINMLGLLSMELLGSIWGFIAIGTGAIFFVFVGAVVGILSGSG